ncbi:hypothetical protein [Paenibacillus sp. FSL H7-0331]|uniref:hypothetical protein n=1 Tax=Paenibacillus sp. FSL H7-0331 TaxID=1920421 RepID=UPI00096C1156|nr:hypothetical protein [Paenibacillus sp. FSL H7-0331]OMF13489.1 hypothetical protein BK127_19795 [Paenibacillus sp. FSL H7-0331]
MSDKVWIDLDDVLEKLQDSSRYIYVDLGVQVVYPTEIVALSRELSPRKLKRLHLSVMENGWQDICPADLSLLKIPDGRYAVDDGGNHRAYISNELGIKEIKASVGTYIELYKLN